MPATTDFGSTESRPATLNRPSAMRFRRFLKYCLPVLAWMIFIFIGSTDLLSAEHTSRFIGPFLHWFAPDISAATIASVQLVVRKCAHLTEYAILAALLYRAFVQILPQASRALPLSFFIAAIYAALDEFHQSFVPTRTGTPWDVLIDCAGVLAGLLLYRLLIRRKRLSIPNRNSKI